MPTILLVDDSRTILMSVSAVLTKSGYTVETAPDGTDGLAKVKAGLKPAVILTDLNMPKMDGITFIRELRKAPGLRFTPILMLTTESQQAKRAEAKAAGASGWLVKPVQPKDLLAVLQQVLPRAA
jgi:two-component system, chemotaxis family, chemotaxis protein CheY